MSVRRENAGAYIATFFVMVGFGTYGIFVRWANLPGKEQYIVFYRVLISLFILLLAIVVTRRTGQLRLREGYLLLVLNGSFFALQSYSSARAVNLMPVKDAIFIIYLAPVLVAAFAPLVLKEKLERMTVLALAVALGGLALISFSQSGAGKSLSPVGIGWAVLSAVCYAGIIFTLKMLREKLPAFTIYVYADLVLLLLLLPTVGFHLPQITGRGWASIVAMGVFLSGFMSIVYVYVVKKVKAQHLGIISYIDPVTATFLALIFLGETPVWQDYAGAALIIAAGVIILSGWDPFATRETH